MTIISFFFAYKSRKRQTLNEIQLAELSTEPYEPEKNVGFSVTTTLTNKGLQSEVRRQIS